MSTDPIERVKDATATHTRRVSMQPEKMLRILSSSTHLPPPPPPTSTSKVCQIIGLHRIQYERCFMYLCYHHHNVWLSILQTKTKIVQQPSPRPLSMVPEKMLRLLSSQSLLRLQKSEQKSEVDHMRDRDPCFPACGEAFWEFPTHIHFQALLVIHHTPQRHYRNDV